MRQTEVSQVRCPLCQSEVSGNGKGSEYVVGEEFIERKGYDLNWKVAPFTCLNSECQETFFVTYDGP